MDSPSVEARLATLEKRHVRMKRLVCGVVALGAALTAVAFTGPADDASFRIVYASKFVVLDPLTHKTRATLEHQTRPGGWAGLTLWDNDGKPRVEVKLWENGSARVAFLRPDGGSSSQLKMSPAGESTFERGGVTASGSGDSQSR